MDILKSKPSTFRATFKSALAQQGVVLVLAAANLDGGDLFAICMIAFVAFWVGVYLVRRHRPGTAAKLDLVLIQVSYVPLCVLTFFLVHGFWKLRGLPDGQ